jgi:hypothetical protein
MKNSSNNPQRIPANLNPNGNEEIIYIAEENRPSNRFLIRLIMLVTTALTIYRLMKINNQPQNDVNLFNQEREL